MHEQQGSICKYAVFWKLDKFADRKKTTLGRNCWARGAHHGLQPVGEEVEAGRGAQAGPWGGAGQLGCWRSRRTGTRSTAMRSLLGHRRVLEAGCGSTQRRTQAATQQSELGGAPRQGRWPARALGHGEATRNRPDPRRSVRT